MIHKFFGIFIRPNGTFSTGKHELILTHTHMKPKQKSTTPGGTSRRKFLGAAAVLGSMPLMPHGLNNLFGASGTSAPIGIGETNADGISIIGDYGPFVANLAEAPPLLSFRRPEFTGVGPWREAATKKAQELIATPTLPSSKPEVTVKANYEFDGLIVEELQWQLPYGPPTEAILLKPIGANGPLPAVLGLHDHGGQKYFGKRKITRTASTQHPMIVELQNSYYSGRAWANELAKRGYVVLVHDVFSFGSRRVQYHTVAGIDWGSCNTEGKNDDNPETNENIAAYNQWAGDHEHILSKSLFCGGTTWPGMSLADDQTALDVLCARPDVDASKIGCCGLSGGGLRADYLGGLDPRVQCAISVGFMSTWADFLLHKAYTHTWMTYTPLLPNYLEFPEIIGLRAPLPTMVMSNTEDQLFTLPEMQKANTILQEVFAKAGASERYSGRFYPGPHKFDAAMQADAFEWFGRWLQ